MVVELNSNSKSFDKVWFQYLQEKKTRKIISRRLCQFNTRSFIHYIKKTTVKKIQPRNITTAFKLQRHVAIFENLKHQTVKLKTYIYVLYSYNKTKESIFRALYFAQLQRTKEDKARKQSISKERSKPKSTISTQRFRTCIFQDTIF